MPNPIIQLMEQKKSKDENPIGQVINMLKSGNPEELYQQMMLNSPKFAKFANEIKGKTPEEVLRSYGKDPSILSQIK